MPHTPIKFYIDPDTGSKAIEGTLHGQTAKATVKEPDIDFFQFTIGDDEPDHDQYTGSNVTFHFSQFASGTALAIVADEEAKIRGFFAGKEVQVDANGVIMKCRRGY